MHNKKEQLAGGYIILLSVLVGAGVLSVIGAVITEYVFLTQEVVLTAQAKTQSKLYAKACAQLMQVVLWQDAAASMVGTEVQFPLGGSCVVEGDTVNGAYRVVTTSSSYQQAWTTLRTSYDLVTHEVRAQSESP